MQSITEGAHAYTRKFYHAQGWEQLQLSLQEGRTQPHRDRRWIFGKEKEAYGTHTVPIIELAEQGQRIVGAVEARAESPYERRGVLYLDAPARRPSDEDKRPLYVELTLDDAGQKSSVARAAWEWLIQKMAAATGTPEPSEDVSPTGQRMTPDSGAMIGTNSDATKHTFTFAGTVDELLEVVREWRAWLPGKPVDTTAGLSSSYVIHEPGWKMSKGTNPDIYTTKRLSESERVNLGAVAPHEEGGAVRQITVKVSLLKYGISLTNPIQYSFGEEPNLENFWFYLAEHYGNLTVYFRRQAGGLIGRLEFPDVVQAECKTLLHNLAHWAPSPPSAVDADPAATMDGSPWRGPVAVIRNVRTEHGYEPRQYDTKNLPIVDQATPAGMVDQGAATPSDLAETDRLYWLDVVKQAEASGNVKAYLEARSLPKSTYYAKKNQYGL